MEREVDGRERRKKRRERMAERKEDGREEDGRERGWEKECIPGKALWGTRTFRMYAHIIKVSLLDCLW